MTLFAWIAFIVLGLGLAFSLWWNWTMYEAVVELGERLGKLAKGGLHQVAATESVIKAAEINCKDIDELKRELARLKK